MAISRKKFELVLFAIILLSCTLKVFGQDSTRVKVAGFPVAYYTPESGLGLGALGLINFNFRGDTLGAKSSSITFGGAYTFRKQILFYLPYNLFLKNDAYRLNGELGFYKYVYYFFGIGNVTGSFEEKKENFEVTFPRFRATALKKVFRKTFVGFKYAFDNYSHLKLEDSSQIRDQQITGIRTGVNAGIGPAFLYDSRNSVFYPRSGIYLDANTTFDFGALVSSYRFTRLNVDFAAFRSLGKKTVLASNLYFQQNTGRVPFYHLSLLGGGKRLRGLFEGEFRDKYAWQTQVEVRQEFFKNWGAAAFVGLGWIAPNWASWQIKNYHFGYGAGLRYKLNKKDHVNIRLDVGVSQGKIYPYLTIGEAF